MVNGRKLAKVGFNYLGVPYSEMDCQKFVEKCLSDCGDHTDLGGSNSWYRECMKNGWVGTPEDCRIKYGIVPPGAFLFILQPVSDGTPAKFRDDGIGDATHIGLVTGVGKGAINSSKSKGCVCESDFSGKTVPHGGWNRIGLWNHVNYAGESPVPHQIPEGGDKLEKATVHSENGYPVKMRAAKSKNCNLYWEVPNGSIVDLIEWGDSWSEIGYDGKTGFMQSNFLIRGEIIPGDPVDDGMIQVKLEDLQKLYDLIGQMLGGVG